MLGWQLLHGAPAVVSLVVCPAVVFVPGQQRDWPLHNGSPALEGAGGFWVFGRSWRVLGKSLE
jgi:hypothetical protein